MDGPKKKILAIASGGGHWVQLKRLRPAFAEYDVVYATVDPASHEDVVGHRFYSFRDVTRRDRIGLAVLSFQLLRILLRERPAAVVTTGSAPGLFAIALAKSFLRCRTIWIDSIANCEKMSTSGRTARRFADVWLTQWENLSEEGGPHYLGAVL